MDVLEGFAGQAAITKRARQHNLIAAHPFDQLYGIDLSTPHGAQLWQQTVIKEQPLLIVIGFPCTNWCLFQRLNYAYRQDELHRKRLVDTRMLHLMVWTMEYQHKHGRLFLFENPLTSAIWRHHLMKTVYDLDGVSTSSGDACSFGLVDDRGTPILKKHRWLCNDSQLLHAVGQLCPGHRLHARVQGNNTKRSGIYTDELADAILNTLNIRKKQSMYH